MKAKLQDLALFAVALAAAVILHVLTRDLR